MACAGADFKAGSSRPRFQTETLPDLENRIVALRRGIQRANDETKVTINGEARTISEWLTWRRDVAPGRQQWLSQVRASLHQIRENAKRQGAAMISAVATTSDTKPTDIVVNVDERAIAEEIEKLEDTLGQLDGQLSLKNATVQIEE